MSPISEIELKEGEKVILVVRRYLLTYFGWFFLSVLCIVPAFLFMFWLFGHDWWGQALFFAGVGLGFIFLSRTLLLWRRNVFLITTHRLIDKEQRGMLDQVISEVPYDQIEDVSGRIRGVFGTLFRYGTVTVQTGGGNVQILVHHIQHPLRLQQDINALRERFITRHSREFEGDVTAMIIDKLYELDTKDLARVKTALEKRLKTVVE